MSKLEEHRRERAPIDHFFRTLAETHDGDAIAVILTGTGSDGTLGVKDIKAKGGLVIVQDPNDAEYDGMPQSAIATGLVDFILPVADIPASILRYDRTQPRVSVPQDEEDVPADERMQLQKVFTQLRARTDRDFSRYKRSTVLRRIARRMQLNYTEDLPSYLEKLRERPEEVRALADDLLITVTSFFRDPEVFERLEKEDIPRLFAKKNDDGTIRVWSVGCATGEEAYSFAMMLEEEASRHPSPPQIQVFASVLHARSLERAREGFYPGDIETDVSAERLKRFFHKENGGYRIRKEIRDLIVFAPHNLLADPPFSRLDLVACRNLLIYLERDIQRDVIELFHYALNPEGILVLGSAESIDATDLFRVENKKLCFFRKRNVPPREPRLPVFPLTRVRFTGETTVGSESSSEPVAYGGLHQHMVEQYAPPSILVSSDNRVVHLSEHAGRYLVHPGGEPTASALKLVREELRIEMQASLQTAREKKEAIDSKPIPVRFNGHARPVVLHVRPALESDREGYVLIIFEEREPRKTDDGTSHLQDGSERIQELEAELTLSRQRMQALIEEYETSREEMKASSEEMQSTNEELRSTMEELETSKEELQSINEELQTVNQQNRHKVEELAQLSSDLQNLLSATEIATLFLDRELRILRFNPKLGDLFNIRVTDRGRPISDLTHRLGYDELLADADVVLDRLVPVEREVQDDSGRWYLSRVLPYRSSDDRIEGVVITFIDIDKVKRTEDALRIANEALLRANVDLRHFSYAVSHDMQEPLRMVTSFSQLLKRDYSDKLDPKADGYIETVVEGARRMEALLQGLREYWSVDKPDGSQLRNVDANIALRAALADLGSAIHESKATITDSGLPSVLGQEHPLTQVFQNLIGNAIKYRRPDTSPRILVSAKRSGTMWQFSVEDNGLGIESTDLQTIFAPFKRLHGADFPGVGLGLAMCQKIIERYNGKIWVQSIPGSGSTFFFTLPATDV